MKTVKEISVNFIYEWFEKNRPEVKMDRNQAEDFYEEIKAELIFAEENNDKELVIILLASFLDNYYSSYTNEVCVEETEKEEFAYTTFELKEQGFYFEEIETFIKFLIKQSWYQKHENEEEPLEESQFREEIKKTLRRYGWNNLIESV